METKLLNYRIIIKPAKEGRKNVYIAECPTLGIYDWGNTIDKALKSIQEGIECHIETLIVDNEEVPVDYPDKEFITETKIAIPINASVSLQ